jgi:hypothetical protein
MLETLSIRVLFNEVVRTIDSSAVVLYVSHEILKVHQFAVTVPSIGSSACT